MRMSCNGCRVLRKGCSEDCSIRPCLQWIKSSDSQANATVFLAKFYGRAGLVNLINSGPDHLRPAIFRSLLYEACGRMVNPIYGSVGLLWSGQWSHCQTAVEAVLKGDPIIPIPTDAAANPPPVKGYDIRHLTKDVDDISGSNSAESRRIKPTRTRFKRVGPKPKPKDDAAVVMLSAVAVAELIRHDSAGSSTSHDYDSSVTHPDEVVTEVASAEEKEDEGSRDHAELELGLTLGLGFGLDPAQKGRSSEEWLHGPSRKTEDAASRIGLRLF